MLHYLMIVHINVPFISVNIVYLELASPYPCIYFAWLQMGNNFNAYDVWYARFYDRKNYLSHICMFSISTKVVILYAGLALV